ncbi:hypothetical protein [Flavobacterium daemonense]|uniref:hypothetical protein n=1 Tax=Flavobacterium daemonense TaxID=1393049 RepID=UPI001184A951|nr:hypothetical protein [Flavobacterium daemonense]KAF2337128.1 hypothetical protein FND99_01585 [Flavobacterium daemonense]
MKKSKLFIFGILLSAVLVLSCTMAKRNELVSSWKVTSVEGNQTPLSDSLKSVILANGQLTFTEDGHVTGFLQREITDGTYALTKQGKSLVIKDETGTPWPCVSTITKDELILEAKEMKLKLKKI